MWTKIKMKISIQSAVVLLTCLLSGVTAAATGRPNLNRHVTESIHTDFIENEGKCSDFYKNGMVGQTDMATLIENDEHGLYDHLLALSKMECDPEGKMEFESKEQAELFKNLLLKNYGEKLVSRRKQIYNEAKENAIAANDESINMLSQKNLFTFGKGAQKQAATNTWTKMFGGPAVDPLADKRQAFALRKEMNQNRRKIVEENRIELEKLDKKILSVESYFKHCNIKGCSRYPKNESESVPVIEGFNTSEKSSIGKALRALNPANLLRKREVE